MGEYYRILSLDGGGIRGLLTSTVLERLEEASPGFLGKVDLFAGTSTGAILALGLASGRTPAEMSALYRQHGRTIFAADAWDELGDIDRLVRPDYRDRGLRSVLEEFFGSMSLGDLPRKVLVASFDMDNKDRRGGGPRTWKPKIFHNFAERLGDDRIERAATVALRSCAAPTYFPIADGYVDGGVVANSPSMCALAQALNHHTAAQDLDRIALLSMGTGENARYVETGDGSWGYAQWAPHLITLMFEGAAGIADYQCRQILGSRYGRISPPLPAGGIGLDAIDRMDELASIGRAYDTAAAERWLRHFF